MKKILGVSLIGLALVTGIVPLFTDCLSQGLTLKTTTGMVVPMKCHWTAIAEIGAAVILGLVGIMNIFSRRKETDTALSVLGVATGALVIAFPTFLIGVCANPAHLCNMIMKPTLIATGSLGIVASAVIFYITRRIGPDRMEMAKA